jgi:hypothetical protein
MPAIELSRLKLQAAQLAERFHDPAAFISECEDLFEFYADRTHRPGQAGAPPPIIPTYRVPGPVIRRILLELEPLARADTTSALALADAFWERAILEFRLMAANVLGMVAPQDPQPILERVQSWNADNREDVLLQAIAGPGLARLREESGELFIEQLEGWLSSTIPEERKLGLQALLALVDRPHFENLPVAFRLLAPLTQETPRELRPYILDILRPLARRSPQETAYFLRQALVQSRTPTALWLTRHALDFFPEENRKKLRETLRR